MGEDKFVPSDPSGEAGQLKDPRDNSKQEAERSKDAAVASYTHDGSTIQYSDPAHCMVTEGLAPSEMPPSATSSSPQTAQQSFANASNQFAALMTLPPEVIQIHGKLVNKEADVIEILANGKLSDLREFAKAVEAIEAKASSLGYGSQDAMEAVTAVPDGYFQRYANHDIYFTPGGEAFEVHGEIRAKYNMLGGATGLLGMPQTDEQGTPDGVGRFNHFKNGSIYWTPRTGPMSVRGTVRDRWASTGWERGPFGYPVSDQYRTVPSQPTIPMIQWCRFENGIIARDAREVKDSQAAQLTYAELGALFGARLNAQFQASPDNVAMRPGVELLGVLDWRYNFWWSVSRAVGFRFRGFHDNGLAPDTDFAINIWLRFGLTWGPTFTEPVSKTLVAVLDWLRVIHEGGPPIVGGEVIKGVASAIHGAFFPSVWPDPAHPEVPMGAIHIIDIPTMGGIAPGVLDILDVLVSKAGDLQFFVNPLTPPDRGVGPLEWGGFRQLAVQQRIDALKV